MVQNRTIFVILMNVISRIEYKYFVVFSNGLLSFFMYVLRVFCETVPKFICEILHTSYLIILCYKDFFCPVNVVCFCIVFKQL